MADRRTVVLGALAAGLVPRAGWAQACQPQGRYDGTPSADFLDDGRKIRLTRPFTYTARCGKRWTAPIGTISDGASIPGWLWFLVGTPLVGRYRNAAIIHDYYCAVRTEADVDVHRMFHEAMLASGVGTWDAAKFYYGVRAGGPSWDDLTIANARLHASLNQQSVARPTIGGSAIGGSVIGGVAAGGRGNVDRQALDTIQRSASARAEVEAMMARLPKSQVALADAGDLDRGMAAYRVAAEQAGLATAKAIAVDPPLSASAQTTGATAESATAAPAPIER